MPSNPFLELSGVTLRINDCLVFQNTNWIFARDQNWALVGSNGSGKTILARALAGELPAVKGEIRYGFRVPAGRIPEDRVVLVSFEKQKALAGDVPPAVRWFSVEQEDALTVRQFLSQDSVEEVNPFEVRMRAPKSVLYFDRLRRRIVALLKIESLMPCSLPSLSNGETRKILLARALLKRPRLLILDDMFTGLDFRFRAHLREILEKLMAEGGIRILLIDSRPNELPRGITHVLYVNHCRVAAQGTQRVMMGHRIIRELSSQDTLPASRGRLHSLFDSKRSLVPQRIVQMEDVSVRYGERTILSGIDWTIRCGESWALIGPNGSGKSTLLSLIGGDNPQAYANVVCLFGRRRGSGESIWDLKKRIGCVSSELHLHFPEDQTCIETVISGFEESMGCYKSPSPRQRKTAQRMLSSLGISHAGNMPFGSLSTGLQRMALLARALVKSPDLLLLDEPCQGLDFAHRNMFLQIIESLLHRGETTIVYVTHVPDEIPKGIRMILQLRNGRIFRSGIFPRNRKIIL